MGKFITLVKKVFIRINLNRSVIIPSTLASIGVVYTIWGFLSLFEPLNGFIGNDVSLWMKLGIGLGALVIVTTLSFIGCCIYYLSSDCTCVLTSNSGNKVYVKYGDLCSTDIVKGGDSQRRNIVIPVNRCFDTIVDDNLISHNTLHGKVMRRLYEKRDFNSATLNEEIQKYLSISRCPIETLSVKQKPAGNLKRYPCGTVAEIKETDNLTYFFLGLSSFDQKLKASTTKAEFADSVQKLIEFCNARSQGYPIVLPLMGTGLSRTNISGQDALNYLVSAFRINRDIINNDFYIVVWNGMKDKISIKNI